MYLRKIALPVVLLLLVGLPLLAEPSIQRFFPMLGDHRFVMLEEITRFEETAKIGPYSPAILKESLLVSYSRWQFSTPRGKAYRLSVFESQDPSGAFSLLTLWSRLEKRDDWTTLDLPVGNSFRPGEGVFWKGKYLIRLTSEPGETFTISDFSEVVILFSSKLPVENLYPVSVSHLPSDGLIRSSVEFYLGSASLSVNERFPEPLLKEIGFVDKIEIAFGRYESGDSSLFLVGYPTPALADEYFIRLQQGLGQFFSSEGIYMKRAGVLIALFVGSEDSAREVLGRVNYTPSIKWLHKPKTEEQPDSYTQEVVSFLGLLTQTILGTGVFILLIVGLGLVAGLVRYAILRRFPALRKPKEMVRLHIDEEH